MLGGGQFGCVWGGDLLEGLVDEGHGFFGEVAAFGDGPLVVLVQQDGADEADHGGVVGEDADDVGAALDLFVDPLERVRRGDLAPVRPRERGVSEHVGSRRRRASRRLWGTGRRGSRRPRGAGLGWRRRRAERRSCARSRRPCPWRRAGPWRGCCASRWTLQRCQPAPANTRAIDAFSPAWASEITSRTPSRPAVRETCAGTRSRTPRLRCRRRRRRAPHGHRRRDPGGDDHGARHDAVVVAGLDVGGVQVHVRHGDVIEPPGAEHGDLVVDAGADPLTPSTSTPRLAPQRPDEIVDLPGRGAGDVRGHDHRPQRLVHPPARLQQRREERPDPQLRDPQLDVTGRRRQQCGSGPVALVGAGVGSFVGLSADHRGELGVDQVLHSSFEQPAEQVLRLSPSPRRANRSATRASSSWVIACVLLSESLGRFSPRVTRWPTHEVDPLRYLHHLTGRQPATS